MTFWSCRGGRLIRERRLISGFMASRPAIGRGISGTGSGFRVGWRTMAGVELLFFETFLLVLAGFSFWPGEWALRYHFVGFRHFPDIS